MYEGMVVYVVWEYELVGNWEYECMWNGRARAMGVRRNGIMSV